METNTTDPHGRRTRKTKMEVDRTYLEEGTKQYYQTGIAVEPSGSPEKGKAKGNMEEMYRERQRKNWTHMVRISEDVPRQKEMEVPCLWPIPC